MANGDLLLGKTPSLGVKPLRGQVFVCGGAAEKSIAGRGETDRQTETERGGE